jgi:hypothetical protein
MADDDFGRAVTWGCGVHLGWILGGLIASLIALAVIVGSIFLCCGGLSCAALNAPVATLNAPVGSSRFAEASRGEVAGAAAERTPTTRAAPATTREPMATSPAPSQSKPVEDPEAAKRRADAEKAEQERRDAGREANRLAQEEADAKTLLDLAKRTPGESQRRMALQSLITKYPNTKAAEEARKLLK